LTLLLKKILNFVLWMNRSSFSCRNKKKENFVWDKTCYIITFCVVYYSIAFYTVFAFNDFCRTLMSMPSLVSISVFFLVFLLAGRFSISRCSLVNYKLPVLSRFYNDKISQFSFVVAGINGVNREIFIVC
jgi:hypothetical protein